MENTSGKTPTHVICDNNIFDTTILFLIVGGGGGGGVNKMHQGENCQDFLKGGGVVFRSFSYNN